MAYKNQKKNKRHLKEVRRKDGTKSKKSQREKNRNHPPVFMTQERCEMLMRQQGLI